MLYQLYWYYNTHTHPFNGHFSGTTQVSRYQKGKTNLYWYYKVTAKQQNQILLINVLVADLQSSSGLTSSFGRQ